MLIKRQCINTGRKRTLKSRKNQNAWRKDNLHVFGKIGSEQHQRIGDERKKFLRLTRKLLNRKQTL